MSRPECGSAADPLAYFVVRCREIYFGLAVAGAARSKVSANRLPHRSRPRIAGAFLLVLLVATLAYVSSWFAAGALTAPARTRLGAPPANLGAEPVNFASTSGSLLAGWFVPGSECRAVVLMHPKDGNRAAMLGRAKFLAQAGYSVLLFDFHAHGESTGESITFGWLESRDALTAIEWMRARLPRAAIGAIGRSLGGVAIVQSRARADAVVLEAVYPTLEEAIANRVRLRLGPLTPLATAGLLWQFESRFGFAPHLLQPITQIDKIDAPLLVIGGSDDLYTTAEETRRLFARAREPKQLWLVQGAAHEDFHRHSPQEYEMRILEFFARTLSCDRLI
jgi:fermentation-respiration switch protein FrsA (DUF1100 family)